MYIFYGFGKEKKRLLITNLVGSSVLKLSKQKMYELRYNCLEPSWRQTKLHYMYTDSFVLGIDANNEK